MHHFLMVCQTSVFLLVWLSSIGLAIIWHPADTSNVEVIRASAHAFVWMLILMIVHAIVWAIMCTTIQTIFLACPGFKPIAMQNDHSVGTGFEPLFLQHNLFVGPGLNSLPLIAGFRPLISLAQVSLEAPIWLMPRLWHLPSQVEKGFVSSFCRNKRSLSESGSSRTFILLLGQPFKGCLFNLEVWLSVTGSMMAINAVTPR